MIRFGKREFCLNISRQVLLSGRILTVSFIEDLIAKFLNNSLPCMAFINIGHVFKVKFPFVVQTCKECIPCRGNHDRLRERLKGGLKKYRGFTVLFFVGNRIFFFLFNRRQERIVVITTEKCRIFGTTYCTIFLHKGIIFIIETTKQRLIFCLVLRF